MKLRLGFVSNSSSSSFLVALPFRPKSKGELEQMLFDDHETSITVHPNGMDKEAVVKTPAEITDVLFASIKGKRPCNLEECRRELIGHAIVSAPITQWSVTLPTENVDQTKADALFKELKKTKGFIYCFDIDNLDENAPILFGDIFKKYPHVWIMNN